MTLVRYISNCRFSRTSNLLSRFYLLFSCFNESICPLKSLVKYLNIRYFLSHCNNGKNTSEHYKSPKSTKERNNYSIQFPLTMFLCLQYLLALSQFINGTREGPAASLFFFRTSPECYIYGTSGWSVHTKLQCSQEQ